MIKYYYGSEVYGQIYDWSKIFKKYRSLNIPGTAWTVPREALNSKYSVILSGRSIGKTTNVILLGLCQRAIYGTQIIYVRASELEFTPTEAKKLKKKILCLNKLLKIINMLFFAVMQQKLKSLRI